MTYVAELKLTDSFSDIVEWCKRYLTKNDIFIDVGANEGMVSLHAMKECDPIHVYLVEACPYFDSLLPENLKQLAPNERYTVVKKLALDKPGKATLYYPERSPSQSSLYDRFTKNRESVLPVILPVTTIDQIVEEFHINNPIVMKIDTELSEHLVWRGAKRSFPIIRDVIMEFMPSALERDAHISPADFLKEIRDDGFVLLNQVGDSVSDEDLLRENSKTDIYLHNKKYGYID